MNRPPSFIIIRFIGIKAVYINRRNVYYLVHAKLFTFYAIYDKNIYGWHSKEAVPENKSRDTLALEHEVIDILKERGW